MKFRNLKHIFKIRRFGVLNSMKYGIAIITKKKLVQFTVPQTKDRITLRVKSSDIKVYFQVFVRGGYLLDCDIKIESVNPTILDLGGNIGLTAIFYSKLYPNATIITVEPEPNNYELLRRNTRGKENIKAINSAIWFEDRDVEVFDNGYGEWGYEVESGSTPANRVCTISATSIDSIIRDFGLQKIDLLKVDIEGSEKELFAYSGVWLEKVNVIVIELHDRMKPGCTKAFFNAIHNFEYSCSLKGEDIIVSIHR